MDRVRERANAHGLTVLVSTMTAALLVLLPSLLITTPAATGSFAALAVLVVGLAALVSAELRSVVRASRSARPHTHGAPAPVLSGRVTDPVHHPLRPRAPGPA